MAIAVPAAGALRAALPSQLRYPKFLDYFHFSFATAMAFSPTDVSAIKPWAELMMMAEEVISLLVAILVVSRAVNILK
jgi:hypothetical protein